MSASFPQSYSILGVRVDPADLVAGSLSYDERLRSGVFAAYHGLVRACGANPHTLAESLAFVRESTGSTEGVLSGLPFGTVPIVSHQQQLWRPSALFNARPSFLDESNDVVVHALCYVPSWDARGFTEPGLVVYATPGTHRSVLLTCSSPLEAALNEESSRLFALHRKNLLSEDASSRA